MYIYQNGKLYIRTQKNILTGVNIDSGEVLLIRETECELTDNYQILTDTEVRCRFNTDTENYIFPLERPIIDEPIVEQTVVEEVIVEVVENEPIVKTKKPSRKSNSKWW